MYRHRFITTVVPVVFTALLCSATGALAQTAPPQTPPDNTKINTRDRAKEAVTADQQKDNAGDLAITQKIRKALIADKDLSTYAHNVKVVTRAGQVTLKGPVRSDDEKRTVEAKAVEVAGAGHVTNEMSVAPAKTAPVKK